MYILWISVSCLHQRIMQYKIIKNIFLNIYEDPGPGSSVGWSIVLYSPEGYGFDSWSGYILWLRDQSPVRIQKGGK